MERCIKSLKEELGPLTQYADIDELYVGVTNTIAYCNNERIHTVLNMSPKAYAKTLRPTRQHQGVVFGKVGA